MEAQRGEGDDRLLQWHVGELPRNIEIRVGETLVAKRPSASRGMRRV